MAKLFFALPLTTLAPHIVAWRTHRPWPGEWVSEQNLHLTLAFLGHGDEATCAALIARVNQQHCPPFSVQLNEVGWFNRAQAAWIGPSQWPNSLQVLAKALRQHGEKCGLGNGERHYRPHVTLSRKAATPPTIAPAPNFTLHCQQFGLYQTIVNELGVHYQAIASWPLRPRRPIKDESQ